MIIKLWDGTNNESWRELVAGDNEVEIQDAADLLAEAVVNRLEDSGHDVRKVYQQTRGALVVCQTPEADAIFAEAVEVCLFHMNCNR